MPRGQYDRTKYRRTTSARLRLLSNHMGSKTLAGLADEVKGLEREVRGFKRIFAKAVKLGR